jgi:hypothetical protein
MEEMCALCAEVSPPASSLWTAHLRYLRRAEAQVRVFRGPRRSPSVLRAVDVLAQPFRWIESRISPTLAVIEKWPTPSSR